MRLYQLQERNMPQNKSISSNIEKLTWGFEFEIATELKDNDDSDKFYKLIYYKYIIGIKEQFKDMYSYFKDTGIEINSYIDKNYPWQGDNEKFLNKDYDVVSEYYYHINRYIDDHYYNEIEDLKKQYPTINNYFYLKIKELNLPKQSQWNIVTDGSITPNGREIVSPILNYSEAKESLQKVFQMIKSDENLFTNSSTGLHINVGTFTINDLDLLKFLVFLNDMYVVKLFNRQNNKFTKIVSDKIAALKEYLPHEELTKDNSFTNQWILDKMDEKYQTVNFSKLKEYGYLEIRAPGGENYEEKEEVVLKLMERIARALTVSMDPNAYRQEYLKKLIQYSNKEDIQYINFNDFISDISKKYASDSNFSLYQLLYDLNIQLPNKKINNDFVADFKRYIIKNKQNIFDISKARDQLELFNLRNIPQAHDIISFAEKLGIQESTTAANVATSAIPFGANTNPFPENSIYKRKTEKNKKKYK